MSTRSRRSACLIICSTRSRSRCTSPRWRSAAGCSLDRKDVRFAPRQGLILILLAYVTWTTVYADIPVEAWTKWDWVWKALLFAIFLPLTLRTKLRVEAALLFLTLSAAAIIIVGGIKTMLSGGGYGVST